MSVTLRHSLGCTEAVIADDGTLNVFYHVAGILNEDLRLKFLSKEDEFDSINWSFRFKGHPLTLHYSIYNGVSLYPSKTTEALEKDNKAVIELATLLEDKLLSSMQRRQIA